MSEEIKPADDVVADPTPATAPEPQAELAGKTFTQAQLDDIVQKAKGKAARAAEARVRDEFQAREPTPEPTKPEPPKTPEPVKSDDEWRTRMEEQMKLNQTENADLRTQVEKAEADKVFTEATAGKNLSADQLELLRGLDPDKVAMLADQMKAAGPAPADKTGPGYESPGGVNGAPPEDTLTDATKWSGDHIARMQTDGSFYGALETYRSSLDGGSAPLFRRKPPK